MKKLLPILAIISIMASCGKNTTTTTTSETTTQKLQHKWNLLSAQDIQYVGSSTTVVDTIVDYGVSGDYIDFKTNGMAYYQIAGSYDSATYSVVNDTKIVFDGDSFTLNTLSSTDLVMTYYGRETNPVNNWDNVLVLKR